MRHSISWNTRRELTFTRPGQIAAIFRCRPYKKNDPCFVEQKSWSVVRRGVGYSRYFLSNALLLRGDASLLFLPGLACVTTPRFLSLEATLLPARCHCIRCRPVKR